MRTMFPQLRQYLKDQIRRRFNVGILRYPLYRILHDNEIDLILDVGANRGQFAMDVYAAGYHGAIWSYEPIPPVFEELRKNAKSRTRWEAFNFALGDRVGARTIKVTRSAPSSSLYSVDEKFANRYFDILGKADEIPISVDRLDNISKAHPISCEHTFVKIDVQGAEAEVIDGGRHFLPSCRGLLVEVSLRPIYSGTKPMEDVIFTLRSMGFTPVHVWPGFKDPTSWHTYDCDVIFINNRFL